MPAPESPKQLRPAAGAGFSGHLDRGEACGHVIERTSLGLGLPEADLCILFASGKHTVYLPEMCTRVREMYNPGVVMGISTQGVIGGQTELEDETGLVLFALRAPGMTMTPFQSRNLSVIPEEMTDDSQRQLIEETGISANTRGVLLFGDPFSTPLMRLLPALSSVHETLDLETPIPVSGGMASAAREPGENTLVINEDVTSQGAIGVTIGGDITMDTIVSQGCRPIGEPHVITKAQRNILFTLGNRPALEIIRETIESLDDDDRELLSNGMFIGRAVSEYKDKFGPGDFLIRAVMGVDEQHGAIAVGDLFRVGQTIQLHVRDASSATEDLGFMLAPQSLRIPPLGALLVSCNSRGRAFFGESGHDAVRVSQGLMTQEGEVPLAGFFAAGEIGPVMGQSYLHGHTASIVVFRPGAPAKG
ncbi:MAG: FIST signal transduction protein [Planctomycetota bacterium]|jgi:small ligand-binding sensory domain FIST